VLDGWFLGPALDAVAEALKSAPRGTIAVVEQPHLARGLAGRGLPVIAVDGDPRSLKKRKGPPAVRGRGDVLPLVDRGLGALVGWGVGTRVDWGEVLAEWSRAVQDGGVIVMVDRAASTELSRRALCGGLAELQQRPAGRLVVTSGMVTAI